jgi:tetratricopeptide (TPR) repeat protein
MSGKLLKKSKSKSRRRHKKWKNKNRNVPARLFGQVQMCADPNAPVVAQTTGLAAPAPSPAVGDQSRDFHSPRIPQLRTPCTAETQRPQRHRGEEGRAATSRNDCAPQAPVSAQLRNSRSPDIHNGPIRQPDVHNDPVRQSCPGQTPEPPDSLESRYATLPPGRARAFRQMAVFPGDFDREAEAAVCQDADGRYLDELVLKGLVELDPTPGRYRLDERARLLASHKLAGVVDGRAGGGVSRGARERARASLKYARHFVTVLWNANELFLKGGAAVKLGLGLFDREWQAIKTGQAWAETNCGDSREAAEVCRDFGQVGAHILLLRQHPEERTKWVGAALRAARKLQDRAAEGGLLDNLGTAYSALGNYRQAIGCHQQSLAIMRKMGNRPHQRGALANLGNAYYYLGEQRRAIDYYEKSLTIARQLGDRPGEGRSLGSLGSSYLVLGEYRRAIDFHEQSLTIARESGDLVGEARSLGALGIAYDRLGEHGPAIERHERQLAISRQIGDRRGEGAALGNLGVAYHAVGQYRRAIEFHGKSLAVARQIGDRLGEADALGNLGMALCFFGNYSRAMACYGRQQAISREIGHRTGEANALWNSSLLLYALGYREEAIARASEALRIYQEIEDPAAAKVRLHIARWRRGFSRPA